MLNYLKVNIENEVSILVWRASLFSLRVLKGLVQRKHSTRSCCKNIAAQSDYSHVI